MDFRQTVQPNSRPSSPTSAHAVAESEADQKDNDHTSGNQPPASTWVKIFTVAMLIGVTVLLCAIAFGIGRGSQNNGEFSYVNTKKYQAVFLTSGQVYFGNVDSMTDKYIHMTNIYYLTQDSTSGSSSNNYSLVKLGCQQIHDPYDAMTINRGEVNFWENLQDDGKVVKSIEQFKQQNPNGPDCSQVSNQTQADSSNAQGTGTEDTTSDTKK